MPEKLTKKQALARAKQAMEQANALPDDDDDEYQTVHVFKVRKNDPEWSWAFGKTKSSANTADDADESANDDAADDADDDAKDEPKPKPRNKFFGGQ